MRKHYDFSESIRSPFPQTPSVVFIHGLIGSLNNPEILEELSAVRTLAPDLLGYGRFSNVSPASITLQAQADHIYQQMKSANIVSAHIVGHSVGWIVAALLADKYPGSAASLISVEGNFTRRDAFWTNSIAHMSASEANQMLEGFRTDVAGWLEKSAVPVNPRTLAAAQSWLEQQPATTLSAMAKSVVATTFAPEYMNLMRKVLASKPFHLIAGEHSREDWDVPGWALTSCASLTVLPEGGHLMMLEEPEQFGRTIAQAVSKQK